MADIRPNQLPDAVAFNANDKIIVDQNANGVRKAEPGPFIDFVAPIASQAKAESGTDNVDRMTSLRTKQSIASEVGVTLASKAQGDKADTAVQSINGKIGNSVIIDKSDVGLGDADNTSDLNKPVSTATQTALDGKVNTTSPRLIPSGGDTDQVLVKSSDDDYDLKWETVAAATAVSYSPQTLTEPQKTQARENINSASLGENSFVGDQEIDGSVTATEFIGDGSQLTNVKFLGVDQTWQDVTATRAGNTTYTNVTGRTIFITVIITDSGAGAPYMLVDGSIQFPFGDLPGGAFTHNMSLAIPDQSTYRLNITGATLTKWLELR